MKLDEHMTDLQNDEYDRRFVAWLKFMEKMHLHTMSKSHVMGGLVLVVWEAGRLRHWHVQAL